MCCLLGVMREVRTVGGHVRGSARGTLGLAVWRFDGLADGRKSVDVGGAGSSVYGERLK